MNEIISGFWFNIFLYYTCLSDRIKVFVNGDGSSTSSENEKRSCYSSEASTSEQIQCSAHPNCTRGIEYCTDCRSPICLECRRSSNVAVNHSDHRAVSLEFALDEAERSVEVASVLLFQVAFAAADAERGAAVERELEARHATSFARTRNELLEQAVFKLDNLRERTRSAINTTPVSSETDKSAEPTFEEPERWSPAIATRQSDALRKLIDVSKGDSKTSLKNREEVCRLSAKLQRWLRGHKRAIHRVSLAANTEVAFRECMSNAMAHIADAENELERVLKLSSERTTIAHLRLVERSSVVASKLSASDRERAELRVLGIAAVERADTFLLVDADNGKIKMLDAKTCKCSPVRTFKAGSYFAAGRTELNIFQLALCFH